MRRNSLVVTTIATLSLWLWAGPVLAAPADITRAPDGELRFCSEGNVCTARAIGDFNGDGMDDIVFETLAQARIASTFDRLRFGEAVRRNFELHLSPFRLVGSAEPGGPAERVAAQQVHLKLDSAQVVDVVTARDLDRDGRADLVFATLPAPALIVLRGRASWATNYDLNQADVADLRLELGLTDQLDGGQTVMLASETADLNGDRRNDLIIGRDVLRGGVRQSEAYVLLGTGDWTSFRSFNGDTTVLGIGACTQGLAGAGDVTGDGLADIVLRRCAAAGQPTQLRVLPGRAAWPATLSAENVPDIVPPPAPPEPEPPVGGGYLPDRPETPLSMPEQVLVQDVNGDGVGDLGIEFAGKTHLFYGGADVAARTLANRTSGIFLHAGFGAMPLTRTWRMLDLNADGRRDLVLSQPIAPSLLVCPSQACGGEAALPAGQPVYGFTAAQAQRRVIDPRMSAPDLLWNSPGEVIWGTGDFSGDGQPDLLLGSPPGAFDSVYTLVFGPLAGR